MKRHRGPRNEPFPSPSPNKPQHRRGGSEGKTRGRSFCRQSPATEGGDQSEQGLLKREPRAKPVSETTTRGGRRAEPRGDPPTSAPARQDLELGERVTEGVEEEEREREHEPEPAGETNGCGGQRE